MATERKPLSGILPGGGGNNDDILDQFDTTEAADDFGPLPKGTYVALAVSGRLDKARTGTDCYKLEFRVIEGERGAARRLGLHPNTLRSRLKRWGVMRPQNAN